MSISVPPVIDIATLQAPGKASISENNGSVTLSSNNPLKALQAIAAQGVIRIHLSQIEIDALLAAGKLEITVSFLLRNAASATLAAQQIIHLATTASTDRRSVSQRMASRKIGWALLLLLLVVIVFLLVISLLDAVYGTHQLETILGHL